MSTLLALLNSSLLVGSSEDGHACLPQLCGEQLWVAAAIRHVRVTLVHTDAHHMSAEWIRKKHTQLEWPVHTDAHHMSEEWIRVRNTQVEQPSTQTPIA